MSTLAWSFWILAIVVALVICSAAYVDHYRQKAGQEPIDEEVQR